MPLYRETNMPRIRFWLYLVATLLFLTTLVYAEKVNLSSEQLEKIATHVVDGKVLAIYVRKQADANWKYTHYVAEIQVEKCSKGEGIATGDLIYVRYWDRAWIGKGQVPPSTSGHRGLPQEGEVIRVYLARKAYDGFTYENNDGGFNVIGANGFEKLPNPTKK